jgi:hypothetical protein
VFRKRVTLALVWMIGCRCGEELVRIDGALEAAPGRVDFGEVTIGLSARQTLILRNSGNGPLAIVEVRPDLDLTGELTLDGVPQSLSAGVTAEVELRLAPSTRGARNSGVVFVTDSVVTPEVRVEILAVAIDPALAAEPPVFDFGRVVIGQSATASITVTNVGDTPVAITAIYGDSDTSSEFTASGSNGELVPGNSTEIRISYRPRDIGEDRGLIIVGDDAARPDKLGIAVRGIGVESEIEIDPQTIDFGTLVVGRTRDRFFTVRNLGARRHTVDRIALISSSGGEFVLEDVPPFDLEPRAERRVRTTYAPIDTASDRGSIEIESTGLRSAAMVSLAGTADSEPTPDIDVAPLFIDFGPVERGTRSSRALQIANLGTGDLQLSGDVELVQPAGGPFSLIDAPATDAVFAPLDQHTLRVEFAPSALGPAPPASIVIASDDPDEPTITVELEGSGEDAPIADIDVSPLPVRFGQVPRGTTAARAYTVTNAGSAPLSISRLVLTSDAGGRFRIPPPPALPLVLQPSQAVQLQAEYSDPAGLQAAYTGNIRIISDDPDENPFDVPLSAETVPPNNSILDFEIILTWDADDTDVDLHLLRPSGALFDAPSDCCWCNSNPDWGVIGDPADDPFLDVDDIDGFGPENLNLRTAVSGNYPLVVHYYDDHLNGATTSEVVIRSQGRLLAAYQQRLFSNDTWEIGSFDVDASAGTVVWREGQSFGTSLLRNCY